ncbi:hypothetical protein DMUE_4173 [Dictyocoela muelleri]|nr:hypothetical protein DMUE_4173 [Dictyocoela muelleri]
MREAIKFLEEKRNIIINEIIAKGCIFCSSKLTWMSKKIFQVGCTCKPCAKIYYLFASYPFTNNFEANCQILLILKYWLSGSNIMELAKWLEISRYSIYRILKKIQKTNIIDKYYQQVRSIGEDGIIVEVDESKFGKKSMREGMSLMEFGY